MRSIARRAATASVISAMGSGALAVGAQAEECANQALRARSAAEMGLPDCRAYEQVTPVNKDGTNPAGAASLVQASAAGDSIVFLVPANMPGAQGASNVPLFMSSRETASWSGHGLLPPSPPGVDDRALGWSDDLSQVALEAQMASDPSSGLYLRDLTGESYRLAVPAIGSSASLAAFSADDSHLIFESEAQLLPNAAPGVFNLYELNLDHGGITLVGILPDAEGAGAPPGGSFAGPYDWVHASASRGGARSGYYAQEAISSDGSRIFFTAGGTGRIYVREPEANPARTIAVSASTAEWGAATPDGRYVLYTEGEQLVRFDVLSDTREELTAPGAGVQGTLGISTDGRHAYFVANGVLASNAGAQGSHASAGACQGIAANEASCNLYEWDGTKPTGEQVSFIAPQSTHPNQHRGDANNWFPLQENGDGKSSRLTPDGKTLLFLSQLPLTGYDNSDALTGQPDDELYRYDATSGKVTCVSCNPTGARPTAAPTLRSINIFQTPAAHPTLTRNLSDDGSRVFFESGEALLARDTNGVKDVYEWERAGAGGCETSGATYSAQSNGCLYLISTGRSPDPSYFADASASGADAFFFTDQPLVGQDQDRLLDVYDARAGGGILQQSISPPTPCAGEACRGAGSSPPVFGMPGSQTPAGAGNLPPTLAAPTTGAPPVKAKSLTRAQKLARALKACRRKPPSKRAACEKQARKKYASKPSARHANRRRP